MRAFPFAFTLPNFSAQQERKTVDAQESGRILIKRMRNEHYETRAMIAIDVDEKAGGACETGMACTFGRNNCAPTSRVE